MAERVRLGDETEVVEEEGGDYFADQNSPLEFVRSGAAVLDCTLGGGWPLTRIANIVGDESTGKTLLAIEAIANFHRQFEKGISFYRESESAFDEEYAEALGMPIDKVRFIEPEKFVTIEDFFDDLSSAVELCSRRDVPGIYVCDSLDALTDEGELKEDFSKGSYGTAKAKNMGKLFRLMKSKIAEARMLLVIVSQTRDKIGAMFPTKTRSGGRALDFYASQVLWLSHVGDEERTIDGVKRVVGIKVRAKCKKNKIALPYRQCDFTIRFGQGIDSVTSSLDWLEKAKRLDEVVSVSRDTFRKKLRSMSDDDYWAETRRIDKEVARIWKDVERSFLEETRRKYRD